MSSYQDEYYYEDSLGGGRAPSDDAENRSIKGGEFILQSRLGHGQFGAVSLGFINNTFTDMQFTGLENSGYKGRIYQSC